MANVNYKRKELVEADKRYTIIRDCLGGELAVKARGAKYLPVPNTSDVAAENTSRYATYLLRATFYNVTKRTLDGLCGQIFVRDPQITVPEALALVVEDASGGGVSITQQAKEGVQLTLGYGRAGLFVDYPATDGAVTQAQQAVGSVRPTLHLYSPWQIINWRTISRGAREVLSLVVLEETYIKEDDGFEAKEATRYRVLRLVDNAYVVEIWKSDTLQTAVATEVYYPLDAQGQRLTEIPFTFIGAKNNDNVVDEPPMYDIASLNLAHYRNSADYEESAFMVGQPTPVFSGLTEDWVKNVLEGKVRLGARGAVMLPSGGTASLLQANPNTMPFEAMQHKEKQMVALGARLVEQRSVVRTATETNQDASTESSVLASAAKNVAAAFKWALGVAARYVGADPSSIVFTLNTDFDIAAMSPEARRQLIEEWQAGALTWEEVRTNLRKSGIATFADSDARDIIDEEQAALPQQSVGTQNAGQ